MLMSPMQRYFTSSPKRRSLYSIVRTHGSSSGSSGSARDTGVCRGNRWPALTSALPSFARRRAFEFDGIALGIAQVHRRPLAFRAVAHFRLAGHNPLLQKVRCNPPKHRTRRIGANRTRMGNRLSATKKGKRCADRKSCISKRPETRRARGSALSASAEG